MKFNKLSALSILSTGVLAAPAAVTVTEHVHKEVTAVVRGLVLVSGDQTLTTFVTEYGSPASPTAVSALEQAASTKVQTKPTPTAVQPIAEDAFFEDASKTTNVDSKATTSELNKKIEVEVNAASTSTTPTTTAQQPVAIISTTPTTTLVPTTTSSTTSTSTAKAAATSSIASSSDLSDNASTFLNAHNAKRALHQNTGSLTWSTELESYAQNYADQYDCSGNLVHSGGPYGENLALGYGLSGSIDAWYDEISSYDFNNPGFSENAGHFTQLVWKSSTLVGCGVKSCNNAWGDYVVCSYQTAGNVIGDFADNVEPLL